MLHVSSEIGFLRALRGKGACGLRPIKTNGCRAVAWFFQCPRRCRAFFRDGNRGAKRTAKHGIKKHVKIKKSIIFAGSRALFRKQAPKKSHRSFPRHLLWGKAHRPKRRQDGPKTAPRAVNRSSAGSNKSFPRRCWLSPKGNWLVPKRCWLFPKRCRLVSKTMSACFQDDVDYFQNDFVFSKTMLAFKHVGCFQDDVGCFQDDVGCLQDDPRRVWLVYFLSRACFQKLCHSIP